MKKNIFCTDRLDSTPKVSFPLCRHTLWRCAFASMFAFTLVWSAPSAEAIPAWAQSFGIDGHGPDTQGFSGTGDDFPLGIAAMPDGGVVVVGKLSYPTSSTAATASLATDALIRYSADGSILWKKALRGDRSNYSTDSAQRFARIVSDTQGNIFLASLFHDELQSGGPDIIFAAKFSPNGDVIWQSNLGGSASDGAHPLVSGEFDSLSLAPNGNLVLTCASAPAGGGLSFPALFVVDAATGSVVFRRQYPNSSAQYLPAQAGSGSLDGTKYLFCTPFNDLSVIVTNAAGDILDAKNYFNFYQRPGATMSIPTADGDFVVLSGNVIRKIGADDVTVGGVTSTTLVTRFERIINYPGMGGHTIVQTADGGYLIGGSITVGGSDLPPNTSGKKAGVYKLNGLGVVTRVFAYGGFAAETQYDATTSAGLCSAVPTTDGGVAFGTDTLSYRNQPSFDQQKPDWWVVKTDALGQIPNFQNVMVDVTASGSSAPFTDSPPQSLGTYQTQAFVPLGGNALLMLAEAFGNPRMQASPPRILSSRTAEAVVGQHFAYHIVAGFFDAGATITYSASGLPSNFQLDPNTGVISGLPAMGSETVTPILITLNATAGTVAATPVTLALTIADGVPMFTVNESPTASQTAGLGDTVLRFAVKYPARLAAQLVHVEANNGGAWLPLANGTKGLMLIDVANDQFVLNSTSYPLTNNVSFRVSVTSSSSATVFSNVVGPFNLTSVKPRAGQVISFSLIRNGARADLDFRAIQSSTAPANAALRVQSSNTPAIEASWIDLNDGTNGHMVGEARPNHFSLIVNHYPASDVPTYFRAVAQLAGDTDDLSNPIGPYTFKADIPPVVTISPSPAPGTPPPPIVIALDANGVANLHLSATATSQRFIKRLSILFDGSTITTVTGGATSATVDYTTNVIGDHLIEASAMDDLGGTARAGTTPVTLRIIPFGSGAAQPSSSSASTEAGSSLGGRVFTVVNNSGYWINPTTWRDLQGNNGVPGINDFVIIGTSSVILEDGAGYDVGSLSLSGGQLYGGGVVIVHQIITISGGSFDNGAALSIKQGAVLELLNTADLKFTGVDGGGLGGGLSNFGTINVHGSGNLLGIADFVNRGILNWQPALLKDTLLGYNLPPGARSIIAQNFTLGGAIHGAGGNVVSNDSAGLITNDGGTLIATGGGNFATTLIANDGGTLITNDGGTLITNDGGTLITNDGGTLIATGGGNRPARGVDSATAPSTTGFTLSDGEIDLSSTEVLGSLTINGGILNGTGVIHGDLTLNSGFVAPGHSPGVIAVTGNYTQGALGTLILEAAGAEATQFDQLRIAGAATLGGALIVRPINGFVPLPQDSFVPLAYGSVTGSFAQVTSNVAVTATPTGLVATLDPAAPPPPLVLSKAASRKTHGAIGPFDVNLPLSGPVGVECRQTNVNGDHQVILTFAEPVQTMGSLMLTSNSGSVTSSAIDGATITVNLTGIANQQVITLGLTNVNTGTVSGNFSVSMGVLLGDTNGNGSVNASDIGQTKSFSGQALDATNFRADVNLSGSINASDIGLVKSKAGTSLPP